MLGLGDELAPHAGAHAVNQRQPGERQHEQGRVEVWVNLPGQDRPAREGDLCEAGLVERVAEGRRGVLLVVDVPDRVELVSDGADGSPPLGCRWPSGPALVARADLRDDPERDMDAGERGLAEALGVEHCLVLGYWTASHRQANRRGAKGLSTFQANLRPASEWRNGFPTASSQASGTTWHRQLFRVPLVSRWSPVKNTPNPSAR